MSAIFHGLIDWTLDEDGDEGHRDYTGTFLVETTDADDGPAIVLQCPDLPQVGDHWDHFNDVDLFATVKRGRSIKSHEKKGPGKHRWWAVTIPYSTKPTRRCQDEGFENPLDEPDRVSGGFVKDREEATHDRHGARILSSSHEMLRGPQVEFEVIRGTVRVVQTRANLEYDLINRLANTVNQYPLWGLPARCVKYTPGDWEEKFYGTCNRYYTRVLELEAYAKIDSIHEGALSITSLGGGGTGYSVGQILDVSGGASTVPAQIIVTAVGTGGQIMSAQVYAAGRYTVTPSNPVSVATGAATFNLTFGPAVYSGWDRDLLDEGTKVLNGRWSANGNYIVVDIGGAAPDPDNPAHFIRFQDRNGNTGRVLLNGAGLPAEIRAGEDTGTGGGISDTGDVGEVHVEYHHESDYPTLLGLPATLGQG